MGVSFVLQLCYNVYSYYFVTRIVPILLDLGYMSSYFFLL